MAVGILTPCNVAFGSGIVTVNSPSGSTVQCDTWLWDDMSLNSPKLPPYWNSTSGSISTTPPQSTCHSASVSEILSNQTTLGRNKWCHVDFQDGGSQPSWILGSNNGFFEKSNYITSYRSSVDTIALNCLVFEKIAFFCILATDRQQTDKQTNRWTASMH